MSLMDILLNRTFTVGLDIGSSSLKLIGLYHTNKEVKLKCLAIKDLPPQTIVNEQIANRDNLLDSIESIVKDTERTYGVKIKDLVISLTGNASKGVFIDRIENEKIPKGVDLTDYISSLIQNRNYASEGEDITFDYKVLKRERNENGDEFVDVLIVTLKDAIVMPFLGVLKDLGLNPVIFDLDVFAIYNVWYSQRKPEYMEDVHLILHIGEFTSSVTLIVDGIFHSSRHIATGTHAFIEALENNLGLEREAAIEVLKGNIPEEINEEDVDKVLFYIAEEFTSYLNSTFRYFNNEVLKNRQISRIFLSGGGATIAGFDAYLESKLELPVVTMNPFESVHVDANFEVIFEDLKEYFPLFNVAMGLALRKTEEV